MLGVYTPLPLRNEPYSIHQRDECLRIDEIVVVLNDELGLNFDHDSLLHGPRGSNRRDCACLMFALTRLIRTQWMCSDQTASCAASALDLPQGAIHVHWFDL